MISKREREVWLCDERERKECWRRRRRKEKEAASDE
jgi:hypothetical protein